MRLGRTADDGVDQRKPPPATADEYVIDKLLGLRQTSDSYSAKARWFDYGSNDMEYGWARWPGGAGVEKAAPPSEARRSGPRVRRSAQGAEGGG